MNIHKRRGSYFKVGAVAGFFVFFFLVIAPTTDLWWNNMRRKAIEFVFHLVGVRHLETIWLGSIAYYGLTLLVSVITCGLIGLSFAVVSERD